MAFFGQIQSAKLQNSHMYWLSKLSCFVSYRRCWQACCTCYRHQEVAGCIIVISESVFACTTRQFACQQIACCCKVVLVVCLIPARCTLLQCFAWCESCCETMPSATSNPLTMATLPKCKPILFEGRFSLQDWPGTYIMLVRCCSFYKQLPELGLQNIGVYGSRERSPIARSLTSSFQSFGDQLRSPFSLLTP